LARAVTARSSAGGYDIGMKLPPSLRNLTRKVIGSGSARPITPTELAALAAREPVLTIAVGVVRRGAPDPALPGEQRGATLGTLAAMVAGEPRDRPIVLHCG
jgi:hypothetical protein